jgi:hypothetical protein
MGTAGVVAAAEGANCKPVHGFEGNDEMRWGVLTKRKVVVE